MKDLSVDDINGVSGEWSLLTHALRANLFDVAKIMIDKGADVNHQFSANRKFDTPLLALLQTPFQFWINHTIEDNKRRTDLNPQRIEILNLMIEKKVNLQIQSIHGHPAFFYSIDLNSLDIAKIFADQGVNLLERGADGEMALRWASYKGSLDFCEWLFEKGEKLNSEDDWKNSCFKTAIWGNQPYILKWMLEKNPDIHFFISKEDNVFYECSIGESVFQDSLDFLLSISTFDEIEKTLVPQNKPLNPEIFNALMCEKEHRQLSESLTQPDFKNPDLKKRL